MLMALEELKVLFQWRLSPTEGPMSLASDVIKEDSSGWWIRMGLFVKANKSSTSSGKVCTKSWLVLSVGFCNQYASFCNWQHSWANRYSPKTAWKMQ